MAHSDPWVALEFIYGLINVASVTAIMTGGIYRGIAPAEAVTPYITIRIVPRDDLQIVNGIRVWSDLSCDVVGVGTALQWDALDRAAALFDPLLQAKSGTTASGRAFSCVRIHPIFFDEEDEGVTFVYVGGSYRITARAT